MLKSNIRVLFCFFGFVARRSESLTAVETTFVSNISRSRSWNLSNECRVVFNRFQPDLVRLSRVISEQIS